VAGPCRIHLLGGFALEVNGRAVPGNAWRHRRASDLVKLLALEPTHHLLRRDVAAQLWPALLPHDAEDELGRAVKEARRAMGDDRAVTTEGERMRLWPHGELWVDVHVFNASAKHARNAEQRRAAIELYRGDLLPEDRDFSWTDPLRTRARLMYLELLRDPESSTPSWIDLRNPTPVRQP
jgi:DNA-binding SARP family transcriptional activator